MSSSKPFKTYGYRKDDPGLPDVTMHRLTMSDEQYAAALKDWETGEYIHPDCQRLMSGMGSDLTLDDEQMYSQTNGGHDLPDDEYFRNPGNWRRRSISCHDLRRIGDQLRQACQCPDCREKDGHRIAELESDVINLRAELQQTKSPALSCKEERASLNEIYCGTCSICCTELREQLEEAKLEAKRLRSAEQQGHERYVDAEDTSDYSQHELGKLEAEVARLKAGGCARNQRLTQFCAEAAEKAREIAELKILMREFLDSVGAECACEENYICLDCRVEAVLKDGD